MIYGFTGTQQGMTDAQMIEVDKILRLSIGHETLFTPEFHHGDCIGADADAHDIASRYMNIVIHPPINSSKRAFKNGLIILEPKEYLDRNRDIVKACQVLIATPKEYENQLRSGTWYTIRQANKMKKKICIIYPDGYMVSNV